jgi:hypothetical protein
MLRWPTNGAHSKAMSAHGPIANKSSAGRSCPSPSAGPSAQSDGIAVKLKAIIIMAVLLAARAAHAETIYLKCWAQGVTGDQLNSVYIKGEQVTVNLDEGTMRSWTFGSNLAVHVTDAHLFFETALTLSNIWQNLFDPTAVWHGFINRVDGTLKAYRRDGTVIRGHCEQSKRLF